MGTFAVANSHIWSYLQFIREYTGKVDELIKDKIEAQKEVKAKEQDEKDVIAQQVASCVLLSFFPLPRSLFLLSN